jgi:hypothetical protein
MSENNKIKTYPRRFSITTPDGDGEATKEAQGAPWICNFPTGSISVRGSSSEVQAWILRHLRPTYGGGQGQQKTVFFGKVTS